MTRPNYHTGLTRRGSVSDLVIRIEGLLRILDGYSSLQTPRNLAEKLIGFLMAPLLRAVSTHTNRLTNFLQVQAERLAAIETEVVHQRAESRNQSTSSALLAAAMTVRSLRSKLRDRYESNYKPAETKDINFYFEQLKALCPNSFDVWKELFENGKASYYFQREASCSHRDHWHARLFGAYVDIHAFGRLLDIGCGPHGLPSYLSYYDPTLVSGLEPLETTGQINFECVMGFNEFLPWPDQAFHTVVSGTSLDHVISLEKSLAEVRRVLTPDGQYLVWLASVPAASAYEENSTDARAIDDFHMFHFDRGWIEPLFEKYFIIRDVTIIDQPGFDHVFYCLLPRIRSSQAD